ncbi:HNH endonuclease signature motif containing protein [Alkalinema sp. FACHB-956]|uniref:HNH endonuclease n=1 Tax=Alkalinema sp. FACHB-956 TaxID=2692768 RepID=UPI001686A401|nr:HNH endonuclease signature motif containing protein [Alkalinema sp. FACHB-956]MBD2325654.1 HNH endonuclease [Alkalinema sp. FACHB-956]
MERPYISQEIRQLVINRADRLCEYCLIHSDDTVLGCSIDHIISLKHNGPNEANNLAYACIFCNRYKGSDIGSIIWETQEFIRFYNPRRDQWSEHFRLEQSTIMPVSSIGEVTVRILGFNDRNRLMERQILIDQGRYPHPLAQKRMGL